MKTYAVSARQLSDWKLNSYLNHNQTPSFVKIEATLPSTVSINNLKKVYGYLIERNETLRTFFPEINGEVKMAIAEPNSHICGLEICADEAQANESIKTILYELKNLSQPPLTRAIVQHQKSKKLFSLYIHHILCDAWSERIIKRELERVYLANKKGKNPLFLNNKPISIKEHIASNPRLLQQPDQKRIVKLKERISSNELIINYDVIYKKSALIHNKPKLQNKDWRSYSQRILYNNTNGEFIKFTIESDLFKGVLELREKSNLSPNTILMSVLALVGVKFTGRNHILIPTLFHNRLNQDSQNVIGNLIGNVLVYYKVDLELVFKEYLEYSSVLYLNSLRKMVFNTETIREIYVPKRCFSFFNFLGGDLNDNGKLTNEIKANNISKAEIPCPLAIKVTEFQNTFLIEVFYNLLFYDEQTIRSIIITYRKILRNGLYNMGIKIKKLVT
ncbi:condensation domain-containing protein [Flagellimonas meridianipacifica]|uniref:Condensation domain-containing protein n=1 Tax=Flagellimonas meridianipacifica TaxID=1080225 RepID=A0A2T0MFQ4_9FLAO|nr:condensation domain-containing protein [Allomuricauda pacifica]PRX56394.1 condensation domain-containing protein [Allomuricauda pacifica]